MALTDKLTAIADEIRNKTGLTDALTLEQMAQDIAASPAFPGDIPDYVQTEAERVAAAAKALQNDNTLSFIAFSDTHIGNGTYDVSITHAMQAAHIIQRLVPIDFTAHLGDHVTGAASDSLATHLSNLMTSLRDESIASPALRLVGNHDANSYNAESYLSAADTDKYIGRYSRGVTKPSSEPERGYFYADVAAKQTRVICLNTGDLKDLTAAGAADGHYVSAAQLEWLVSALDMTGKSGWRVIVLSHHPIHWYGSMPGVLTIQDAYVAGTGGSVTVGGATVSYDFSGKNAAKLAATFHGHTHNLIHGVAGTAEIVRMGTPNACFTRSNEYGSDSYTEDFRSKYGETTTYNKTADSAKDTAFCVYTIDFENEVIYAACYGAGYDRTMSYGGGLAITTQPVSVKAAVGDTAVFSVSATGAASYQWQYSSNNEKFYDLPVGEYADNVTADTLTVNLNSSSINWYFRCKLTGYDGTVLYTNAANILPLFTNRIPISVATDGSVYNGTGYKEGYRISTSSGGESVAAGMTVTGFIPLEYSGGKATIRIKDIDLTSGNSTGAFYGADFSYVSGWYCDNTFGAADENGVRSYTSTSGTQVYVRIAGAFGENPIITVNEEIV